MEFKDRIRALRISNINDFEILKDEIEFDKDVKIDFLERILYLYDGITLYILCEDEYMIYYGFDIGISMNSWNCGEIDGKVLVRKWKLEMLNNL